MVIPPKRTKTTDANPVGDAARSTSGCAVGVIVGAITGGILGAIGRAAVAAAFLSAIDQSGGTFFAGLSSESLGLIGASAAIGFVACGVAGATCRVLLAAPIGAVLSAMPCFVLVVFPSTFLMSMSGGNTEPDVRAVLQALVGMAVVGAVTGAAGAFVGRLAMKALMPKFAAPDHSNVSGPAIAIGTPPATPGSTAAHSWIARPDNWWLVFCVGISVLVVVFTVLAVYSMVGDSRIDGLVCFAPFVLLVLFAFLVAGLFFSGPIIGLVVFLKTLASSADQNEKLAFETLARLVDGQIHRKAKFYGMRPRAIEFYHRGLRIVIDSEHRRAGQSYVCYARATLDLPKPIQFHCDLSPQGKLDTLLRAGDQDVTMGWEAFDNEFRVRTNKEEEVVQVLDRAIQQRLMQFKQFSKRIRARLTELGRVYFSIDSNRIEIRAQGVISKPEEIIEFHQQCTELFDRLLPRLGLVP